MRKTLAQQQLPLPSFDWNENIKWIAGCISALLGYAYYIALYFKHRAKEKEEFIESVVKATLKQTLDGELKGIKDDVKQLFDYREADRTHIDEKFSKVMAELRK